MPETGMSGILKRSKTVPVRESVRTIFSLTPFLPVPISPSPSLKAIVRNVESVFRLFCTIVSLLNEMNSISGVSLNPGSVAQDMKPAKAKSTRLLNFIFNRTKFVSEPLIGEY